MYDSKIWSRLALEGLMGSVEGRSACGSRWLGHIHATRPGEQAGRTTWWCESENDPSDVAARAGRSRRAPYRRQRCGEGDGRWPAERDCAGDDGGTANAVRLASWPAPAGDLSEKRTGKRNW